MEWRGSATTNVFYDKECGKDHIKLPFPHTDHSLQEQSNSLFPWVLQVMCSVCRAPSCVFVKLLHKSVNDCATVAKKPPLLKRCVEGQCLIINVSFKCKHRLISLSSRRWKSSTGTAGHLRFRASRKRGTALRTKQTSLFSSWGILGICPSSM